MPAINRRRSIAAAAAVIVAAVAVWFIVAQGTAKRELTGLFTSLPIIWSEAASVGAVLQSGEGPHWARATIAGGGQVVALDFLDAKALAPLREIVIAQPRPLAPIENVALDNWVRGGGRVLLIADPALTEGSIFPLGDPRRPQAVALMSPILARWGLELQFDDRQPAGAHVVDALGGPVVVDLPGRFQTLPGSACRAQDAGLVVNCHVGKGSIVAFADAAFLRRGDASGTGRRALSRLLEAAFPPT